MKFKDISQDKKNLYTLKSNEKVIFFMLNRNGEITFELAGENAEAHIFSFFVGTKNIKGALTITQKHIAPRTKSHAFVKSVLFDESEYNFSGLIAVNKQAKQSDTSQESRALILSPFASISAKPALEILIYDVKCRHSATISSLNPETLFFANSRGLSEKQATTLLINGFFNDAIEKMHSLGIVADFNFDMKKL
jgi:Fe-S cluster assembly scaffold protein SufB